MNKYTFYNMTLSMETEEFTAENATEAFKHFCKISRYKYIGISMVEIKGVKRTVRIADTQGIDGICIYMSYSVD